MFPAALLGAALCGAPASLGADEPRARWEHRCIDAPRPEDLEPVLNHWGEDGWELAAAVPTGGARGVDSRLCFKRARPGNGNAPRVCRPSCGDGTYCLDAQVRSLRAHVPR